MGSPVTLAALLPIESAAWWNLQAVLAPTIIDYTGTILRFILDEGHPEHQSNTGDRVYPCENLRVPFFFGCSRIFRYRLRKLVTSSSLPDPPPSATSAYRNGGGETSGDRSRRCCHGCLVEQQCPRRYDRPCTAAAFPSVGVA